MKQENKELLLKDLAARLPYGVKILNNGWDFDRDCEFSTVETLIGIDNRFIYTLWRDEKDKHSIGEPLSITDYKPYLRSMSSMSEKERKMYREIEEVPDAMDYLLSHHFDCRYLIERGLAIEVTEENNPYKNEKAKSLIDKVEPKFKVKYAGSEYNVFETKYSAGVTFYGIEDEPNHIDYVQAENCEIIGGYGIKENGSPYPTKPAVFSEQKSAWSEEDEKQARQIERIVRNDGCSKKLQEQIANWLKSLKDRVQPQLKQEWKQENTHDLTDFENVMMHIGDSFFGQYAGLDPNDTNAIKEQANILLELVPKQEWNEEDENTRKKIIKFLKEQNYFDGKVNEFKEPYKKEYEWLKSLRPQNGWKPSEEQMKALSDISVTGCISYAGQGQELINLYNELNKLREK